MMKDNPPAEFPLPGQGKRGEEGYLGYLLRQANGAMRLTTERVLEDLGVTLPQFLVMTMINAYPGSSGADIARLAVLTPQTISLIVANLQRAGLISREVRPTNGRAQNMTLTDSGQALLSQCRERTRMIDTHLRVNLTPDDERVIRRWLVDIATRDLSIGKTARQ